MLQVFHLQYQFRDIQRLQKVLIARRLLFKKINIMLKGESPKLKCAIYNVPVHVADMGNTLPPALDSNGLVIGKLERKIKYRVYVYFKSVLSDFIIRLLQFFLKNNNHLYSPYTPYGVTDS